MHHLFESGYDDFNALLAQARQRLADRKALVQELVASGKPVKMKNRSGRCALVCPDMSSSDGRWRVSYFDDQRQPLNHTEHQSAAAAFTEALQDGYRPF